MPGDPVQKAEAFAGKPRQDEVAHQGALLHEAFGVVLGRAGLAAHFRKGLAGNLKIIRGLGAQLPHLRGIMLEVGQIDIYNTLQRFKSGQCLVATGIPNQGQGRAVKG